MARPNIATGRRRGTRGFTLIELMVTVAIVAILAAIAYPSYRTYVRKGNRAAAEAVLMDIATREHQYLLDIRRYVDTTTLGVSTTAANGSYQISVQPNTTPGFVATATPVSAQTADSCGTLTIDQGGTKLANGAANASCW
jgi:type IV pilus assembly protein PilE